jgi:hypothetical protein
MAFTERFIETLNNWQKGWKEDQTKREDLAEVLKAECFLIDPTFKEVSGFCYRKRFLHHGDYVDILLKDSKNEGVCSWTTDLTYAEIFKGIIKPDAQHAAVFEHHPTKSEIILNIKKLWESYEFVTALKATNDRSPEKCAAIYNFKHQGEVILEAPLKGSEIIALTGKSSSFDVLCDIAEIPEEKRPAEYKRLIDLGYFIEEIRLLRAPSTKNAVRETIKLFKQRYPTFK